MKILSSFQGGLFTRHKQCYESGELSKDFSRLHYFFPATTDRIEKVNQHMSLVFLKPIDIEEHEFGGGFNPSVLDGAHPDKEKAREVVLEVLKKTVGISNSNLGQNADALLCTMSHKDDILWAGQENT